MPKQEHSELRVERKIGSQNAQLLLNPNVQECKTLPAGPTAGFAHLGTTESTLLGGIMDKMALTVKQGFVLPKKELTTFVGDPRDPRS